MERAAEPSREPNGPCREPDGRPPGHLCVGDDTMTRMRLSPRAGPRDGGGPAGCSTAPAAESPSSLVTEVGQSESDSVAPSPSPSASSPRTTSPAPSRSSAVFEGRSAHRSLPARRLVAGLAPRLPVGIDDLGHVKVSYRDFTDHIRSGPLIVHETVAEDVLSVFRRLFRAGFPIHRSSCRRATTRLGAKTGRTCGTARRRSIAGLRPGTPVPVPPLLRMGDRHHPLQNPSSGRTAPCSGAPRSPTPTGRCASPAWSGPGTWWCGRLRASAGSGGATVTLKDYMHFSLPGR